MRRDQDQADTILWRSSRDDAGAAVPARYRNSADVNTAVTAGDPTPVEPQPGSAPRWRKQALIAGIAVAAVVAIILGGVGIWWLVASGTRRPRACRPQPSGHHRRHGIRFTAEGTAAELRQHRVPIIDPPITEALSRYPAPVASDGALLSVSRIASR